MVLKKIGNQLYQHLINGIGFMIPFVITGGIATALSFLFQDAFHLKGVAELFQTIGQFGMLLMWPAVAGGIAYSMAARPGLVAGCVAGFIANEMNTAFFGAAIGGFLSGYSALMLLKWLKLPKNYLVLKETMLVPILSTFLTSSCLLFIFGKPLVALNALFTLFLTAMSEKNAVLLGAIIGFMMIIDLAGPIGKAAYFFGVATLDGLAPGSTSLIMGAVMIGGMVPPLSLALAMALGKRFFPKEDLATSSMLWVLGATFVTESVIAYTVKDLPRILPGFVLGSMTASSLSMWFNCGLSLPHGGFFAMMIPGAVSHLGWYLVSLLLGIMVSTSIILLLKRGNGHYEEV
ncbi:PTS fructose transporter subunit IIC [Vagococcus sp. BWB3-3]|uniref:PTS fructose transporter subunit IIC n=1 Tax=Vagococcus allomyrinae TaxID=2794353 RepID=A0A940SST3_9ENTE|nr:PTS fructose transporter subunit IIC [Vagococcus allomyrinae]MBP1039585.1 PTS fructose transporter subunit IIC [Vagococcus allomyrinae]